MIVEYYDDENRPKSVSASEPLPVVFTIPNIDPLDAGASTEDVVIKINEIIAALRGAQG